VKDRPAKYMIANAEQTGQLKPGGTIVEATAGNTGIGLVYLANAKGYKTIFVCPDKTSNEKVSLLRLLGAEVLVVPTVGVNDPNHFAKVAERKAKEVGGFYTNQFANPHNLKAHYETTGPELWAQTQGNIDALVLAPGTGGTLGGCSIFLKEKNPDIRCFAISIQGSGVDFVLKEEDNTITFALKSEEQKKKKGLQC